MRVSQTCTWFRVAPGVAGERGATVTTIIQDDKGVREEQVNFSFTR